MSGRRARRERGRKAVPLSPRRRWRRPALALAAVVLVAAVAVSLALTRGSDGPSPAASANGGSAAPLRLSGSDPITGGHVSLAPYRGRPIVLNLWASWCTGCYGEARALATFERTHPQGQVVGVDIQDTRSGARAFYRRFGWRHPSIFDPHGVIAARFGLQGLPATIFLNRRHQVVAKILGETDLAGFDAGYRRSETR